MGCVVFQPEPKILVPPYKCAKCSSGPARLSCTPRCAVISPERLKETKETNRICRLAASCIPIRAATDGLQRQAGTLSCCLKVRLLTSHTVVVVDNGCMRYIRSTVRCCVINSNRSGVDRVSSGKDKGPSAMAESESILDSSSSYSTVCKQPRRTVRRRATCAQGGLHRPHTITLSVARGSRTQSQGTLLHVTSIRRGMLTRFARENGSHSTYWTVLYCTGRGSAYTLQLL